MDVKNEIKKKSESRSKKFEQLMYLNVDSTFF